MKKLKVCRWRKWLFFGPCKFYHRDCILPCRKKKVRKNRLKKGIDTTMVKLTKKARKKR